MKTYSKEIRYTETIKIHTLPHCYFIEGSYGNFFVEKKSYQKALKENSDPMTFVKTLKHFHLLSKEFVTEFSTVGMSEQIYKLLQPEKVSPSDFNDREKVKELESRVFHFDSSSHLAYQLGNKYPFSRAYHQSYISGICNDLFDLKKAEEVLKKLEEKGWVSKIHRVRIPYYNSSRGRNESVEFTWHLPQDEYEKLFKLFKKSKYPSCQVSRIVPYGPESQHDPLGLKAALFAKPKELVSSSDDEDEDIF